LIKIVSAHRRNRKENNACERDRENTKAKEHMNVCVSMSKKERDKEREETRESRIKRFSVHRSGGDGEGKEEKNKEG